MELWICILVPNLSTPDGETCAKKLDLTEPHFSPSVNKKKIGRVGNNARKWMLNTSIGSVDATALGEKAGDNSPKKRSFLSALAITPKNQEFPNIHCPRARIIADIYSVPYSVLSALQILAH